jgi:hypothetical protein
VSLISRLIAFRSISSYRKIPLRKVSPAMIGIFLMSCGTMKNSPKYQLSNDKYQFRQEGSRYKTAFVYRNEDTVAIYENDDVNKPIIPDQSKDQLFLKRSFDIDVMTILFRYRPARMNLPRQLTTDFNGNIYLGYRFDRFKVSVKKTPIGPSKSHYHRAITIGGFAGLGSSQITPSTTNYKTTDEYNGLTLTHGISAMVGVNNLTVGVGVGWDYLTDKDKDIWIYQKAPWVGLTIGLNIN